MLVLGSAPTTWRRHPGWGAGGGPAYAGRPGGGDVVDLTTLVTHRLVRAFAPGRGRWARGLVAGTAAAAVATTVADRIVRRAGPLAPGSAAPAPHAPGPHPPAP